MKTGFTIVGSLFLGIGTMGIISQQIKLGLPFLAIGSTMLVCGMS